MTPLHQLVDALLESTDPVTRSSTTSTCTDAALLSAILAPLEQLYEPHDLLIATAVLEAVAPMLHQTGLLLACPAYRETGITAYAGEVPVADPRPLLGEPLPLDLLNTTWMTGDGLHDLLADEAGARIFLDAHGFDAPADAAARRALRETREALRTLLVGPRLADGAARRERRAGARWRSGRCSAPAASRSRSTPRPSWRVPWICAAAMVDAARDPRATASAAAPTPTACSGSWTRRAPARGAGARWPRAATATRRSATVAVVTGNFALTGYHRLWW